MSSTSYFLKNARIVNEGLSYSGDLLIDKGIIRKIFTGGHNGQLEESDREVIDLDGLLLLPGVIDDQVHFREPGLTHKGSIQTESRAAVAGGITSYMEMPNTLPQTTTQARLEEKFRLGQQHSLANFSFYIGATNDNLPDILASNPELVCGIKVFMGSSTGNMLVDDPGSLSGIFREARLPVAVHCEDEAIIRARLGAAKSKYGEDIPPGHHPLIRNHEACLTSSRLAVSLAERYDTRLHLLHLSTLDEIRMLDNETPLKNKRITAEVCVHHLWFSMDDYAGKGAFIKWNPAVKYEEDRRGLIRGIREGFLDVVATDHAPHTREEKLRPYTQSPSGGPMVQHALPAMMTLAKREKIPLEQIVQLMCHNPAICFNLSGRGFIREGYAADLVVVDPDKPWVVESDNILCHCGWSPLEGTTLAATVEYTFVNGNLVYKQGSFDETIRGEALRFSR